MFSSGITQCRDNLYQGYITTAEQDLINLILSPDGLVPSQIHEVKNKQATVLRLSMSDYVAFDHIIKRNQEPVSNFTLKFLTPCFIKRGNHYDKLPSIERIISSVYRNWINRGWPEGPPVDELTAWAYEYVMIEDYYLRPRTEKLKNIPLTGMTGQLKLVFTDANPEMQSFILSLLDFASLVGIGAKTALGFGWVELQKGEKQP